MLQEISIGTSVIDRIKDNIRIRNQMSLNDKKIKEFKFNSQKIVKLIDLHFTYEQIILCLYCQDAVF